MHAQIRQNALLRLFKKAVSQTRAKWVGVKVILILVLWLQEVVQRAVGEGGEGGVGRREDCRCADVDERVDEVGGCEGRDERAEVRVSDGKIDDGLR